MPDIRSLPAPPQALQPAWSGYEPEPQEQAGVPLSHYLWILRRHRWRILGFILFGVAATIIVSARLTPVYEGVSVVDIDRQMPQAIIGQEATRMPLNDADQFIATQIKLVLSDAVLRPVAQQYRLLDVEKQTLNKPRAKVENAPVVLKKLSVKRPPNTFLLLISYRSTDPNLAADVANAISESYVKHSYDIRFRSSSALASFMEKQLEELKAKMERSSAALAQFERELNVINPEEKTSILSSRLLQLNTEFTNAQTDRVRKESAWKSVQGGTLAAAQVSTQGDDIKALVAKLQDARERFADAKTHYGSGHPEYRKASAQVQDLEAQLSDARQNAAQRVEIEYYEALNREGMLRRAVTETKAEFDALNARSFEYQALKHEAEADKALYEELIRKIKEAGINAGFENSSIRVADLARPAFKPVFPNWPLNIALAFVLSTMIAVGVAVMSDSMDKSIRDPEQIASLFKTEVIGSLPQVKGWRRAVAAGRPVGAAAAVMVRSNGAEAAKAERSATGYEEAIRTLRNSILLGTFDKPIRSLMITSATPSEGKTTTAVHLAIAHAEQKHKTLLIDCDLRRPGVHGRLGFQQAAGLSTVLQNGMLWREKLLRLGDLADLDVLLSGPSSRRVADLVGSGLQRILEEAASEYDLIVIDSPPLLGFPEPLQIAAAVDGVVLVAKAGETNRNAVGSALNTLQRVRANVVGMVLNEVTKDFSDSYHYYGYYGYGGNYNKRYASES